MTDQTAPLYSRLEALAEAMEPPHCPTTKQRRRIDLVAEAAAHVKESDSLLREAVVKLRDVQGSQAPKDYAANLIPRMLKRLGNNGPA